MPATRPNTSCQLYTIKEFAAVASFSIETIRRRIKDGTFEFWQPGGPGTRILLLASNLPLHPLSNLSKPPPAQKPSSPDKVPSKPLRGRKLGWKRAK